MTNFRKLFLLSAIACFVMGVQTASACRPDWSGEDNCGDTPLPPSLQDENDVVTLDQIIGDFELIELE